MNKFSLVQVNFQYGDNVFLPYSIGLLAASVKSNPRLNRDWELDHLIYMRHDLDENVSLLLQSEVVGFSCYIWNWEYTLELAKRLKQKNPNVLVVFGGPQVPHANHNIFLIYPFIDLVVIGEGELVFQDILEVESPYRDDSFIGIKGLLINNKSGQIKTGPRERPEDLSVIPSPYLDGTFDQLISNSMFKFQASQETHRGCPYSCTFCDWGSATMQKVRRFPSTRIYQEFEWIGRNKIEVLYNCDANYGLFKEDVDLTIEMINVKKKYGFPSKFRAAFAKNSNDRIFEINKMLNEQEMSKGATLSLQSVDAHTLDLIKRRNMKINDFSELVKIYDSANMPTYTELIVGLPGESYESFGLGINKILEAGQHDGLNIYPAMILPNAVMNEKNYKDLHGIKTVITPLLLLHGSPKQMFPQEKNEIVIETSTMSAKDWKKTMLLAWTIQALHCLNLTQFIAKVLKNNFGIEYTKFYETLIAYCSQNLVLEQNLELLNQILDKILEGKGDFDLADRRFGNIVWPVEEILFLRLLTDGFYDSLPAMLSKVFGVSESLSQEIVDFQIFTLKKPKNDSVSKCFSFNFLEASNQASNGLTNPLKNNFIFCSESEGDFVSLENYAREIVWYGRKGSNMKRLISLKLDY